MRKAKRKKELKNLSGYLLTHSVTLKDAEDTFHSVRWFGSCSYNKFMTTPEELKEREREETEDKCKLCGSVLIGLGSWERKWFDAMFYGDIDKPKYWDEVCYVFGVGGTRPSNTHEYLLDGGG